MVYENNDTAHLFMGGLVVAAWIKNYKWQWILFWLLCLLEIIVAIWIKL